MTPDDRAPINESDSKRRYDSDCSAPSQRRHRRLSHQHPADRGDFSGLLLPGHRPGEQAAAKNGEMLSTLKKGDRVLTTGGIYGTVQGVEAEVVYLKIAENVKVKVARSAITGIISGDAAE